MVRERALSAAARQREAQDMAKSGTGSFLDVLNANLEAYKARGQLVEEIMAWHAARARLKLAQGLLVLECCSTREKAGRSGFHAHTFLIAIRSTR